MGAALACFLALARRSSGIFLRCRQRQVVCTLRQALLFRLHQAGCRTCSGCRAPATLATRHVQRH
eukprot:2538363-Prymnesium_polylepis.2